MANIFILITILFWGIGSFLGKTVLKDYSALATYILEATGTLTVAAVTLLFFQNEAVWTFRHFKYTGYLFGILWGVGTITFVFALKYKPANVAVPLTALYPLITAFLVILFLKEPVTLKIGAGILLAITSAYLLLS